MALLDEEDWAEVVADSAYSWFRINHLDINSFNDDPHQVKSVQSMLEKYQVTPEQRAITSDLEFLVKHAVYEGLFNWAAARFVEICPDCEKSTVMAVLDDNDAKWKCRKDCGWYGEKTEVLRTDRK